MQDDRDDRTTWWFWVPELPKPLIVSAWAFFWSLSVAAPYLRHLAVPGQPWWLDLWHGAGGNAIGVFTWAIIAIQLTVEVAYMIFTLRANRRQVEQAAVKNRDEGRTEGREEGRAEGREEGLEEGMERGQTQQQQMWLEWYEQVKDQLSGDTPPPPSLNNGNGSSNGSKGD